LALWAIVDALQTLASAAHRDADALMTAEELGELLQLSPRTLKDQAAAGVIAHHRFGKHYRFSRGDVTEILRSSAQTVRRPGTLRIVS
jgi:excisionase family DNA binding protein